MRNTIVQVTAPVDVSWVYGLFADRLGILSSSDDEYQTQGVAPDVCTVTVTHNGGSALLHGDTYAEVSLSTSDTYRGPGNTKASDLHIWLLHGALGDLKQRGIPSRWRERHGSEWNTQAPEMTASAASYNDEHQIA